MTTLTHSTFDLLSDALNALAKTEAKAGTQSKRVAAAALVRLVEQGGDKQAIAKVQAEVNLKLNISNSKMIMAWVNKATPKYGDVVTAHMPDAAAAVEALIDVMADAKGNTDWTAVREEFRPPKSNARKESLGGAPAEEPKDTMKVEPIVVPPPVEDEDEGEVTIVAITPLAAVLNRLGELSRSDLERVVVEANALLADMLHAADAKAA